MRTACRGCAPILPKHIYGQGDLRSHPNANNPKVEMLGQHLAIRAADNFRRLRRLGVTVRKTIDIIIATACIENGLLLLYSDRNFDPCCKHLGLRSALGDNRRIAR